LLYNIGDKELTAASCARAAITSAPTSPTISRSSSNSASRPSAFARRSPLGPHPLDRAGPGNPQIVDALYQKHVKTVEQVGGISNEEFATLNKSLHRLERFWTDQILYRL